MNQIHELSTLINQTFQDFRFPSFPRQRESSKPLKKLDTRFRGYDEFKGLGESPAFNWNKARIDCLVGMLIALLSTRSMNLTE
ncbi:MAG: hypothetical protein IPL59_25615 [Candidatus Competibacteraceae bacterium]|uniref:Uncharacterized protein n=1 Tax=Candidatus Contendobacter odensis Run_B_J11 TaxID=1400861 RepID=A0A7U7J4Y8_9GAMM|nr:hypothetical protein [Candidatus Contendobacter odensis]MBK8538165.1 hypothetical protein [Candidatus Competibacteraceae bacterium]MBK8752707.1 hypothetical protein [Candidatus Competibacteraceae bacterium]CDH46160.1 hypothetical protein BN874_360043 [Candidatus Contendobacter odensis Run_B_J11]